MDKLREDKLREEKLREETLHEAINTILSRFQDGPDRSHMEISVCRALITEKTINGAKANVAPNTIPKIQANPLDEALVLFCKEATEEDQTRVNAYVQYLLKLTTS